MDSCRFGQYDREGQVVPLLRELGFNNLIDRIPTGKPTRTPSEEMSGKELPHPGKEPSYKIVVDERDLVSLADSLDTNKGFAFDTETTNLDAMQAELVGLSFSMQAGKAFYVPLGHSEEGQIPMGKALGILAPILEREDIPKAAHNG